MWHKYKYTLASLVSSSVLSIILVMFRIERTGNWRYLFLIWNLTLAWAPLVISFVIHKRFWHHKRGTVIMFILGIVWLVFYPNAPYILTDLIHLDSRDFIPLWYDLLLIISFATAGGFAGFVSLYLMQNIVIKLYGKMTSWLFVSLVTMVSSFGVYLGRFLRWNTWDLLSNHKDIASDVLIRLVHPLADKDSLVFTAVFAAFSLFTYFLLYSFLHLHAELDRHV